MEVRGHSHGRRRPVTLVRVIAHCLLVAVFALAGCTTSQVAERDQPMDAAGDAPGSEQTGHASRTAERDDESLGGWITGVETQRQHLVYGGGASLAIGFSLDRASHVRLAIRSDAGTHVRTLDPGPQGPGRVTVEWDGLTQAGAAVSPGVYLYAITARDEAGGATTYGAARVEGGEEVFPKRFAIDPQSGIVSYGLPQASWVRLRALLRGYPLLATLMDWRPQPAGQHEFRWDGLDRDGMIQIGHHPNVRMEILAFALPENAVIVEAKDDWAGRGPNEAPPFARGFRHALHAPANCREPDFEVDFPDADAWDEDGNPILGGESSIRIRLDPRDAAHLINQRFEAMFFVDTLFLFEEEEGTNPFSYRLDTTELSPGRHLLTVNVLSGDDHAGVRTLPFVVARGER